jgi:PTH1 family peptidyl-tRNA hydrolase
MNKLIIGLGNPGHEYKLNKHNVGFMIADAYRNYRNLSSFKTGTDKCEAFNKDKVFLLKPLTMMNGSGVPVKQFCLENNIASNDVLVIHDDSAFDFGEYKIKPGGGSGGHKGVQSIINNIGGDFNRFRIGIGKPSDGQILSEYVLSDFGTKEGRLFCGLYSFAVSVVDSFIEHGAQYTMGSYQRR